MQVTELLADYKRGKRYFRGADLGGADLGGADLRRANLGGAYLRNADLRNADLRGANLSRAYLHGADLRSADLGGADLRGADLGGADLRRANLGGAYLRDANLGDQWIIQGSCRSDGYWFSLQKLTGDSEPMIKAGCRYFSVSDAIKHWQETRGGTQLGDESLFIVNHLIDLAKARKLI